MCQATNLMFHCFLNLGKVDLEIKRSVSKAQNILTVLFAEGVRPLKRGILWITLNSICLRELSCGECGIPPHWHDSQIKFDPVKILSMDQIDLSENY